LLGVIGEEEGIGAEALESVGVTAKGVEAAFLAMEGPGKGSPPGQIPFTPRAKKALELSLRESLALGHNYIGTEHVLLGLIREEGGNSSEILRSLDIDRDRIRNQVIKLLSEPRRPKEASQPDPDLDESVEAIPTHPDRPAERDELGRALLAGVLGERIRRARGENTETPAKSIRDRWNKRRRDAAAAREIGSFMVHIHAPWGAGKSSLLNFLADDLRNRSRYYHDGWISKAYGFLLRPRRCANSNLSRWIVVEFSAWEHQRLVAPWWWLLASIQRSCGRELWQISRIRWAWFWLRDIAWRLWNARAAVLTALLLCAFAAAAWASDWFGLPDESLSAVQTVTLAIGSGLALATSLFGLIRGTSRWLAIGSADGAVRFLKRAHDPLGVYRRRFRWLVRSSGRPITVFIDDLDRCRSDYVVELLEGIQTLFAAEPVTYVVAADRTWVCESFANTYSEFKEVIGDPGRPLGFLFLEKTFQISIEIPPMSSDDQTRYWDALMRGAHTSEKPRQGSKDPKLANAFAEASTQAEIEEKVGTLIREHGENRDDVMEAAMRRMNSPTLDDELEKLLSEFAPLLEKNPRSMKRLMNAYGIERDRLLRNGYLLTREERRQLVLLTILWLRWPLFAEYLRATPEDARYFVGRHKVPDDHPYGQLFAETEVRRLFDGSHVRERLNASLLQSFPARSPS
jgi:KAP-like P-loop domain-containing protein/ClpA/ClpB-like protein